MQFLADADHGFGAPRSPVAAVDFVSAVAVGVLLVLNLALDGLVGADHDVNAWTYVLSIAAAVPLAHRSAAPRLALVATSMIVVAYAVLGHPRSPIVACVLVALYSVAASRDRVTLAVLVVTSPVVIGAGAFLASDLAVDTADQLILLAAALLAMVAGDAVRSRRALAEAHAEQLLLLRREQEGQARRQVLDERRRIARDLHDVVSHTISSMTVQAGVAAHVLDADPASARTAMVEIRDLGRSALGELRTTLQVLRDDGDVDAGNAPVPTIGSLPSLVERSAATVTLTMDGPALLDHVDPVVQLAAYRIVQEALTNVAKHAPGGGGAVDVAVAADSLTIRVVNDEAGGERNGDGFGLIGMRERAETVDGTLVADPAPDGRFTVEARLPIDLRVESVR